MTLHRYTVDIEYFDGDNGLLVSVSRHGEQIFVTAGTSSSDLLPTLQAATQNIAETEAEEMQINIRE